MSVARRAVRASAGNRTPPPILALREGEVTSCPRLWGGGQGVGSLLPQRERPRSPSHGKGAGGKVRQ